jgi:hypothetical protein
MKTKYKSGFCLLFRIPHSEFRIGNGLDKIPAHVIFPLRKLHQQSTAQKEETNMRLFRWAFAGALALALAGDGQAQDYSSALTGVNPSSVTGKRIDTSGAISGTPVLSGAAGNSFSLSSFFRRMTGFGAPIMGGSSVPVPTFSNPVAPSLPINSTVSR